MAIPQYKDVSLWTEDDILGLPTGEHDWLEFKASAWFDVNSDERWQDASKYLSAWANYDGGYLILGVVNPKAGQPLKIDGGVPNMAKGRRETREWLEAKLPSLVDPTLEKISVQAIFPASEGSSIKQGHCVIVIYISSSAAAPHQASDNKYYTRLGSSLFPLGNRAVRDIIGRAKTPQIVLKSLRIEVTNDAWGKVLWHIENQGSVAARNFSLGLFLPLLLAGGEINLNIMNANTGNHPPIKIQGVGKPSFYLFTQSNTVDRPLFPLMSLFGHFAFFISQPIEPRQNMAHEVKYKIYADDAPVKEGAMPVDGILTSHFTPPAYWG